MKFKLKKEARQFFVADLATKVGSKLFWEGKNIHTNLLQEVPQIYVELGHQDGIRTDLRGWNNSDEIPTAHFMFTVRVNDISFSDYENFKLTELMDKIQSVIFDFNVERKSPIPLG